MEMFALEFDGRRTSLQHSMRAQEFVTPDRARILQRSLLKQRITPINAESILLVRFPGLVVPASSESSRMQQMTTMAKGAGEFVVRWTGIAAIAGATYKVGKQAYRTIANSPLPGLVVRFPGVTVGTAFAVQLWGSAMGSYAARQVLRAAWIHHFITLHGWLHLPASMRGMAVLSGVRTTQYITSGLIPGLFTAWALYDGYRLGCYVYSQYQEHYNMQSNVL